MNREILAEDIEFYKQQELRAKWVAEAIERSGFTSKLYTPPGGWKTTDEDKERRTEPYPNQLLAAYRIFYHMFCIPNPVVLIYLAALFQGGKTGVIQALTRLIFANADKISRYGLYVTTAMNDTSWLKQTKERLLSELEKQIYHLGTISKLENNIKKNIGPSGFVENILLIDDESRIGSKDIHRKGDVLRLIKKTSPFENWRDRKIRYLAIDATDPACAINMMKLQPQGLGLCITLELPPSYLSIKKLREQQRFHQAYDLRTKANIQKFKEEFMEIYGMKHLFHLVRLPSTSRKKDKTYETSLKNFKEIFGENFRYQEWNGDIKEVFVEELDEDNNDDELLDDTSTLTSNDDETDINTYLNKPPAGDKPIFIFFKNYLRAGKTIIDKYIGAMCDRNSTQDDVIGQSFAGRASGHKRSNQTHIWTNLKAIDRLIDQWQDVIQMDDELSQSPQNIIITPDLHGRMPHLNVIKPIGSNDYKIQTTGKELSRPENLAEKPVENLPNKLKSEHMLEGGPFHEFKDAISHINTYYGTSFSIRPKKTSGGYYINSRLLSWYRKKYNNNTLKTENFTDDFKLSSEDYSTITKTFGCSSRTGQPYLIYPVYTNSNTNSLKWYVRYAKKEFTRYNN